MTNNRTDTAINILRAHPRIGAAALRTQLGDISRATLSRVIHKLGDSIISGGGSKRTRYALRRTLRGNTQPIPIYRIDINGQGHEIGQLTLTHPEGSHLTPTTLFRWPLDQDMADGWFEGLPYPIVDMRPQGFLGRRFAKTYASNLQLADLAMTQGFAGASAGGEFPKFTACCGATLGRPARVRACGIPNTQ